MATSEAAASLLRPLFWCAAHFRAGRHVEPQAAGHGEYDGSFDPGLSGNRKFNQIEYLVRAHEIHYISYHIYI